MNVQADAVKAAADAVDIAREYCRKVVKAGSGYMATCIFHDDKTPSLSILPDKKFFTCMGCDFKGDVIAFVQKADGLSFKDAVAKLAARYGLTGNGASRQSFAARAAAKQPKTESGGEETFQRFGQNVVWPLSQWLPCHEILMARKDVQDEFAKRGIQRAALEHFKIGMVDNGRKICRGYEEQYAKFIDRPWIGFPYIYGDQVRLVKWRPIFSAGKGFIRPKGMADCLLVDTPTPDPEGSAVLVEGEVDALSVFQIGYHVASLPSGAKSKITAEMLKYLKGFKRVFLCLDNDLEGKAATLKWLKELPEAKTSVVTIPEAQKDANKVLMDCGSVPRFETEMKALFAKAQMPNAVSYVDLNEAFRLYAKERSQEDPQEYFGFPWDNVNAMGTIQPGDVVSIASKRSGQGKTTFAVQTSLYNALHLGRTVGYYSAEMDPVRELIPLITAQLTRTNRNHLTPEAVEEAREMCSGADFYFGCDPEADSWDQVRAVLESGVRRLGLEVIVIDHLDFIIREGDWRREMATKGMAMKWLKNDLARKYGVIVVILRQTTKGDPKTRNSKKQDDGDVYDVQGGVSGVTDTNHSFMISRKKVAKLVEGETEDIYENETAITCGKTRMKGDGSAIAKLMFIGKYGRFEKKASPATADMWEEGRT